MPRNSAAALHLEPVLAEHAANASQLMAMLRDASPSATSPETLDRWCRRCDANLDGLRIAGPPGLSVAQAAIDDDPDAAAVVACLLAEWTRNQPRNAGRAVAMLRDPVPDVARAAWWGLRLSTPRHLASHLARLAEERGPRGGDYAAAAALDLLAFHRLRVRAKLPEIPELPELRGPRVAPNGEEEERAWLLVEAAGRIPGAWSAAHLRRALAGRSARVREAALRASARCALPELVSICRDGADRGVDPDAVEFLGVVGSDDDVALLTRAAQKRATARAAVRGLGRLGLPGVMPALLYFLDVRRVAEAAAWSIARITGEEVPRGAPEPPPPGLSEDQLDLWEPTAPVDVRGARAWWDANAPRFESTGRYQAGLRVSDEPLGPVFDQLPATVRYDVYLRERALVPGTPDWELETWTWRQRCPGG